MTPDDPKPQELAKPEGPKPIAPWINTEKLSQDVALGGEMSLRDVAVPFLYILQQNSPQCTPESPKHIKGAVSSMLLLTQIDKIFEGKEQGLEFIPCYYVRELVEWRDRNKGGGIVDTYDNDDPIQDKVTWDNENKPRLPNGNLLVETAYHMILVKRPENGALTYSVMPLKSTALKESRKLNNMVADSRIPGTDMVAPRFFYRYRIITHREQKDTQIWFNPTFTQIGPVETEETYELAKKFAKAGSEILARARAYEEAPDDSPAQDSKVI